MFEEADLLLPLSASAGRRTSTVAPLRWPCRRVASPCRAMARCCSTSVPARLPTPTCWC